MIGGRTDNIVRISLAYAEDILSTSFGLVTIILYSSHNVAYVSVDWQCITHKKTYDYLRGI